MLTRQNVNNDVILKSAYCVGNNELYPLKVDVDMALLVALRQSKKGVCVCVCVCVCVWFHNDAVCKQCM